MGIVENSLADIFYASCPPAALSPYGAASSFPLPAHWRLLIPGQLCSWLLPGLPLLSHGCCLLWSLASTSFAHLLGFLHICFGLSRSLCATSGSRQLKQSPLASAVMLHQPLMVSFILHFKFKPQALKGPRGSALAWDTALVCSTCVPPMEQNAFCLSKLSVCFPSCCVVPFCIKYLSLQECFSGPLQEWNNTVAV